MEKKEFISQSDNMKITDEQAVKVLENMDTDPTSRTIFDVYVKLVSEV